MHEGFWGNKNMKTAEAVVWIVALLIARPHTDQLKLAVHQFESRQECEAAVPYIKRYYRLYGNRWRGSCQKAARTPLRSAELAK